MRTIAPNVVAALRGRGEICTTLSNCTSPPALAKPLVICWHFRECCPCRLRFRSVLSFRNCCPYALSFQAALHFQSLVLATTFSFSGCNTFSELLSLLTTFSGSFFFHYL